ncbi:hypothetical protein HYPSUDRAFT_149012 [Hypholoma sublateritium FD-334 SS-4]|uniref:Uncharacterized protein n=1 Tax=Hypholoma sublateritium (strain FD-334 SS-4) TaxID=945553 RepID=A0A0D2KLP2_HYPSF|nr:hypothetical protein HYPSUDRAFT_149012 [Hypholoma sublateritium FD-334 SS-4]
MKISNFVLFVGISVISSFAEQIPLSYDASSTISEPEYHTFKRPVRRVAVIGAGVGGLIAFRELKEAGFDVHLFERDNVPGGNWHYTEETAPDAPIPNRDISVGDYIPSLPPKGVNFPYTEVYRNVKENAERKREHRGPKPIWDSLTSNTPAPIQQVRQHPWPVGTPWALHNRQLQGYVRAFASFHGVNSNDDNPAVSYNTRVELAEKHYGKDGQEDGWILTTKSLVDLTKQTLQAVWNKEHFDAIVVATGRYNGPNVPNIPGMKSIANQFPSHIQHSRQYRRSTPFSNKTVLLVGAGTSGVEISRELAVYAKEVYFSIRVRPIPRSPQVDFLSRIPSNVTIVGEIKQFKPSTSTFNNTQIELVNGTILTGIDHILLATGYRYSYPFLPIYHNSTLGVNDTAPIDGVQPIVTDGTHLRSLHLDAFYIPDPTLGFINANWGTPQSFTYAEFAALAMAKTWAGKADLPSTKELWRRYNKEYKERRGYGRHFQFLTNAQAHDVLRYYQGWLNSAAVKYGGKQVRWPRMRPLMADLIGLPTQIDDLSKE